MSNIEIISRFAPSPTGMMHFGNFRTVLFNYLFTMQNHGKFILRIEDTDTKRSDNKYLIGLLNDLKHFNIHYDNISYQSRREDIYNKYYQKLIDSDHAYNCFCSEEELTRQRKLQLVSLQAPRYIGTCRNISRTESATRIKQGLSASLRFRVPQNQTVIFNDAIRGKQSFSSNDFGDFIIRRWLS